MGNNIPNFDDMTTQEIGKWAWDHRNGRRTLAARIFPGRPKGYVCIVQNMARVAAEVAAARRIRDENGNMREAYRHEDEAERIMDEELPEFARPTWTRPS